MENNFISLYNGFKEIVNKENEEAARQFLTDHINEFPEDVKNGIILTLFEDAVNEAANKELAVLEFKREGIEIMTALEQAIRILDDKLKVLELEGKL